MSGRKRKKGPIQKAKTEAWSKGKRAIALVVLVAAAVVVTVVVLFFQAKKGDMETAAKGLGEGSLSRSEPSAQTMDDFQKLIGKWLRPDGGYILDIRGVDNQGALDASYLNPRPIHVSRAEASKEGSMVKVFIELQDVGYPGSSYNLIYDPGREALLGIYYQAHIGQSFEVVFVRMK